MRDNTPSQPSTSTSQAVSTRQLRPPEAAPPINPAALNQSLEMTCMRAAAAAGRPCTGPRRSVSCRKRAGSASPAARGVSDVSGHNSGSPHSAPKQADAIAEGSEETALAGGHDGGAPAVEHV
ncbi:hypothetical protein MTO96_030609 [Rhipicephalus appendiculatus]